MAELKDNKLVDGIVYVTWVGGLRGYPLLHSMPEDLQCITIETKPANIGGIGNVWHQMKALDRALAEVPNDYRVLKIRPDVDVSCAYTLLSKLLSGDMCLELSGNNNMPRIFQERIWVPWFEISKPFYLADECFYGNKVDIAKLVNIDIRFDALYDIDTSRTHIRRFIMPYLSEFPFYEDYLYSYGRSYHSDNISQELLNYRLLSPVYSTILAGWYRILSHYFYICGYQEDGLIRFRDWLPPTAEIPHDKYVE